MKKPLKAILTALFLLVTVWTLYNQTQDFDYLNLDDHDYTFRCAFVKDGLSAANVKDAFLNVTHAAIWMPATYISYMADVSCAPKLDPRRRPTQADIDRCSPKHLHHQTNAVLHALNAVLLFFLLLALTKADASTKTPAPTTYLYPLLAALFWAVHPQRAEAVAWIASRKEILCGTFTLAGLLCWLRASRAGRLGALACCVLACMSKPTAMCFPFLALALDLLLGRLSVPMPFNLRRDWKTFLPYAPLLVPALFTGELAMYSQTLPEGLGELALFTASFPWRLLNAMVALGLDFAQLVVPVGLHLDYRAVPEHFPLQGGLGLSVFFAVTVLYVLAFLRLRAQRRALLALLLFFLAARVPTLGIFGSFGEHARADRFLYLPMLVASMAFVLVRPRRPRLVAGLALVACLAAGGLAYPLIASYADNFTAFSRTLACDPHHGRALRHVAHEEFFRRKHLDKGIELYRRSQAERPRDDTVAWLAYALMKREYAQDYAEIRTLCAKFTQEPSLDRGGMALEALGMTALREHRWKDAIAYLTASIKAPGRSYPSEDAFLHLGIAYSNNQQQADALEIFERLVRSRYPDIAESAQKYYGILKANPKAVLFL